MQDRCIHVIKRRFAKTAGMTRYFTGKPCCKNHISERFVSSGGCIFCVESRTNEWRSSNPEKARSLCSSWRSRNKQRVSDYNKKYREENSEQIKLYAARYHIKNIESISIRTAQYRVVHAARLRAKSNQWKYDNPERAAQHWRNRKALKKGADGTHTGADVNGIFHKQKGRCASCLKKLKTEGKEKYHVDHIYPLCAGGSNDKYNLQCLCPSCNLKKKAQNPIEWAQKNGRLL